jgi:hypothetical protein
MFKENNDRAVWKEWEGTRGGSRERQKKGKSDKGTGGVWAFVDAGGVDKGWLLLGGHGAIYICPCAQGSDREKEERAPQRLLMDDEYHTR